MPAHRKCNHDGPRFASNGACKQCTLARRKARRQADPESVNAYNRQRRVQDPKRERSYSREYRKGSAFAAWYARNRPKELWKKAKQRANKAGRTFDVTVQDVESLLAASSVCPYTKVPYESTFGSGRNPWAASLDRKDSTKGYTLDNLEITSLWWNLAKSNWSGEVMARAIEGLRANES